MHFYRTKNKLSVITEIDEYLISNNRSIEFAVLHNEQIDNLFGFNLVLAKYIEGNFSIRIKNVFMQSFNGNYFFFLYANDSYTKYILDFKCTTYILDKKAKGL